MKKALPFLFCALLACPLNAEQIFFDLVGNAGPGLLPGNVTPGTTSLGEGGIGLTGIIFDTDTNILHVDIEWGTGNGYSGDLTGEVTMLHLHGPTDDPPPAAFSQRGPLIINLGNSLNFDSSASSGGLVDDFFISNADVAALLEGRTYINVHTSMYEMGEIRGYIVQSVPEPSAALVIMACGSLFCLRRRR